MKSLLIVILAFFSLNILAQDIEGSIPTTDVYNGGRGLVFNNDWSFYHGDVSGAELVTYNDASWRKLNLPHEFGIENSFNSASPSTSEGGFLDGGIGWYRKTFTLSDAYKGKSISITFDGSFMNTEVWINGTYLGIRPYGFITFQYDITPYLKFGSTANVIAVKVNNVQKSCRWYSGTGIYRNVWLTVLDPVHIPFCGSVITTPVVSTGSASVSIKTDVYNQSAIAQNVSLLSTVFDNSGSIVGSGTATLSSLSAGTMKTFNSNLVVNNPVLWSLENPYLYALKTYVVVNDAKVDSFSSTLGFRNAVFDANNGFSLNGKSIKIHGVCLHQDLGCLGSAQNYRALERQIQIMKSMGVNGIRTSHNPAAPELLEICDRLGLVVMDEVYDCWSAGKDAYDYHLYYPTWMPEDVKNWVIRDRNHPSVIMWSAGNEIPQMNAAGATCLTNILTEIKKYDTTRPVSMGLNNWSYTTINDMLDLVGFNYANGGTYDSYHSAHPASILFGSETSSAVRTRGVYHTPTASNILTSTDMQCSSYDNSVVGWGHSAENSWKYDRDRAFVAGQFIWTGFDYIGEPTPYNYTFPVKSSYFGIVDLCGFPKDIYYFYQSQWTEKPIVHILPHWNWQPGKTVPVWTYSNCDSVRLIVNGTSFGAKSFTANGALHLEWNVPFVAGSLKAFGFKKGIVVAKDSVFTAGDPSKIELKADRDSIRANGLDLAYIETNILDANGVFCPTADTLVNYSITGPGKIVGVDNGNPASVESFKGTGRRSFNGKCLAVIQSTGEAGQITVTASSPLYMKNLAKGKTCSSDSENVIYTAQNIAIGKTVTADSEETGKGNIVTNAVDGDAATRWCANDGNLNHWIMVDLGSIKNLTGSEIVWEKNGSTYLYKIETSTDNLNWTVAVDKTVSNTSTAQAQQSSFLQSARYVRLTVTWLSSGCWASLFEFRLFDGSLSSDATKYTAANATDNNISTAWMAADGAANHWWMVDLGLTTPLTGSEITWANAGVSYQYKIEASTNKSTWSTVADKTATTSTTQKQSDNYSTNARYLKVTITGGVSLTTPANIAEFKVFDGSTTQLKQASVTINAIGNKLNTAVPQPCLKNSISVYPNPASSVINVEFNDNKLTKKNVGLYNTIGVKVQDYIVDGNQSRFQLDVSTIDNGIYFLKINGVTEKVLICK